jgi:MFS family permease
VADQFHEPEVEAERPAIAGRLARLAVDITPLRTSRPFRRLWFGTGISAIGSQITSVAIPFQVYDLTHSTLEVGLLSIAGLVPILIVPLYAGAVADAVDRRRLLLLSDVALALVSAGLLVNALLPSPRVWALFVFQALSTGAYGFQRPARNALTPRLVGEEQLTAAIAVEDTVFNLAHVAGPAIGGVLIAAIGLHGAYGVDLATFGASMLAIWLLPSVPPMPDAERPSLRSIAEGFRYISARPVLLGIFVADTNAMIFGMPEALFPAFGAHLGGGAETVGFLYAAPWIGAFVASVVSGWITRVRRQGLGVCVAIAVWGGAIALFGFSTSLWVAVPLLAVAGAADFISAVLRSTILLSVTPDTLRGRLSGIELAQVASTPALGNLEAGVVASLVDLRFAIVSGGVACIAGIALVALALPAFVSHEARHAEAPA